MRIRRVPGLMLLTAGDAPFLYDAGSGRRYETEPLSTYPLAELLLLARDWREQEDLARDLETLAQTEPRTAAAILEELLAGGILEREESATAKQGCEATWWARGWEDSFLFHLHTNRLPKLDYAADPHGLADKAMMERFLQEGPQPSSYKDTRCSGTVELSRDRRSGAIPIEELLSDNVGAHGWRGPMTLEELSWFVRLAVGQTATRKLPVTGEHVAKTSPSGGSRHPTEVYVVSQRISGLARGVYHYNVRHHALDPLREGDFAGFVQQHVLTHPSRPGFEPTVTFILSCLFERSMFRYRDSRSYRVIHHDLGHVLQTMAWLGSSLGRSSYRGYSFHDSVVERFLGVDGLEEAAMAFCVVG